VIPNITRGGRIHGLLAYLVGPARDGSPAEHVDPHLVAGDESVMAWHAGTQLDRASAQQVAEQLDHPHRVFGTRVTQPVKRRGEDGQLAVAEAPGVREVKDADVWHCSLSLRAEEGVLEDERWAQISEQFVARMGFADAQAGGLPCRWAAVRHGLSKGGNDHVHIVVSLVREDGTKASTWNDRPRAQTVAGELEVEHGLQVLESRAAGRGTRGVQPAEREIAARRDAERPAAHQVAGAAPTARESLARTVRGCAAASADEAEFVRRVVRAGVRIRPRFAKDTTDVVAGYSVALRAPEGARADWYGGGRLARDLTLPRLRAQWPDTPQSASAAVREWNAATTPGARPYASGRETSRPGSELWHQSAREVMALAEQLRAVGVEDRATWAHVAHETAGAFAAWSLATEATPGPLAATADVLARSAQLRAQPARAERAALPSARGAALVLASIGRGGSGPVAQAVLLRQLASTARAVQEMHRAAGQARQAAAVAAAVRTQLIGVRDQLPAVDESGLAARIKDAQAAEALRVARQGQVPYTRSRAPRPAEADLPPARRPPGRSQEPER